MQLIYRLESCELEKYRGSAGSLLGGLKMTKCGLVGSLRQEDA